MVMGTMYRLDALNHRDVDGGSSRLTASDINIIYDAHEPLNYDSRLMKNAKVFLFGLFISFKNQWLVLDKWNKILLRVLCRILQSNRDFSSCRDEKQIKNILEQLEKKYKNANVKTKQTGWGVYDCAEITKDHRPCPYYNDLDKIWGGKTNLLFYLYSRIYWWICRYH